jgi:hypothetical protein
LVSDFGASKLCLLAAQVAAGLAYLAAPTPAVATPITYTLSGASATFDALGTDTFTGTFTFDPATHAEIAVDITVTGPVLPDIYDHTGPSGSNFITIATATLSTVGHLSFINDLSTTPNPLSSMNLGSNLATAVTGSAVPVPNPAPGPIATLALLAVGLFLIRPRANRGDRQAHADQPEGA